MAGISRRLLRQAVYDRLKTDTLTVWYDGQVPGKVATSDTDGHIKPYGVLYASPGTPGLEQDLADTTEDLDWLIQVTCVGAFTADLDALLDRTHGLLYRWAPTVAGVACGRLKPPPGFDPGPQRVDDSVTPVRLYVPLQYQLTATT